MNRSGPAPSSYQGVVNRYVIEPDWADLQLTDNGSIQTGVIDPLLSTAQSLGSVVKVHVFTGTHDDGSHGAPQWVLDKCGTVNNASDDDQHVLRAAEVLDDLFRG